MHPHLPTNRHDSAARGPTSGQCCSRRERSANMEAPGNSDRCVPGGAHSLIQIAMGWDNAHRFAFYLRPLGSRPKRLRKWEELDPESEAPIENVLVKRSGELIYEYDFSDSWIHSIKVEKRLSSSEPVAVPRCTAGEGSCPPEGCGGIGGYGYLLVMYGASTPPHQLVTTAQVVRSRSPAPPSASSFDPARRLCSPTRRWACR